MVLALVLLFACSRLGLLRLRRSSYSYPSTFLSMDLCDIYASMQRHWYLVVLSFLDTGDLFSWGTNKSGVCGLGHDDFQFFPVQVSFNVDTLSA